MHRHTTQSFISSTYDLLVNVVLGCLYLWHILRVPDKPQDLITTKRQSHEDKQGLGDWIGTENGEESGMLGMSIS